MRILLIEDDPLQAEFLRDLLQDTFPNMQLHVFSTESDLVLNIDTVISQAPGIALVDLMLRWTNPAEVMPPRPDEVIKGGSERAGIRCARLLRSRLHRIPIVLFTALDTHAPSMQDVNAEIKQLDISYLEKTPDFAGLIAAIRRAAANAGTTPRGAYSRI